MLNKTNIIIGIIVLILAVAVPLTVRLAQQQTQLKSKAAETFEGQPCTFDGNVPEARACVTSCPADKPVGTCGGHNYCVFNQAGDHKFGPCQCETAAQTCAAPAASPPAVGPPACETLGSKRADVCEGQLDVYNTCASRCVNNKKFYFCTDSRNSACTNEPNGVACPAEDSQCATGAGGPTGNDLSSCGLLLIDNKKFGESGFTIEVNKPHTATIQMSNPTGTSVNPWDEKYSLEYVGDGADKTEVSPKNIPIPNNVRVAGGAHYTFTNITFTPKVTGNLNFFWQMKGPNVPQLFGARCESTLSITTPAGAPVAPGTSCTGPAGIIAGAAREWRCVSTPLPAGCVGGSADSNRVCSNGFSCFACSPPGAGGGTNTFSFGQCGVCKNNPKSQTDDPKCEDPSAQKDDDNSKCTKKTKVDSKEFKNQCVDATCVSASKARDCLVCFGNSCTPDPSLCADSAKPFCETIEPKRGFCTAGPTGPSPSPLPSPPAISTACFFIDDKPITATSCQDKGAQLYDTHPKLVPLTLSTAGRKTIFARFISNTGAISSRERVINFMPNPAISEASCTHAISGAGTSITITGQNFGPRGKGKVKVDGTDAEVTNWNEATGVVTAILDKKLEGKNNVELIRDDGKSARAECLVGTTTVTFAALTQCKAADSNLALDNVSVKIFANVPVVAEAEKPEPVLEQIVKLDKDGKAAGFTPKLEKNKKYALILKAPNTLAKKVEFETKTGTKNLDAVTLLVGDIAPSSKPDGKINAVDRGELIRQWNLVKDVAKSGDFNGDGRINSIDYACMRQNINQSDEEFSPPTPKPSPVPPVPSPIATPSASPTASPSASPSPPAGGPGAILPFRVSFDPNFTAIASEGDFGLSSEKIISLTLPSPPGQKSVYVQFLENGVWGPSPPQTASILLK